jgi:hypothetical protein
MASGPPSACLKTLICIKLINIVLTGYKLVEKPHENQTPSRSTSNVVFVMSCCKLHHSFVYVATHLLFSSNINLNALFNCTFLPNSVFAYTGMFLHTLVCLLLKARNFSLKIKSCEPCSGIIFSYVYY